MLKAIYCEPGIYPDLELMEEYEVIKINNISNYITIKTQHGNKIVHTSNFKFVSE